MDHDKRANPDETFARAITAEGRQLLNAAWKILDDYHLAEDAVAQTYLKAWRRRRSLRSPRKLGRWLLAICRRESVALLRKRKQERARSGPHRRVADRALDEAGGPEERWLRAELLAKLPEELKVCAEMSFFDGRSYAEIASVVALPLSTVRGRIYQSRRFLRKEIIMESKPATPAKKVVEPHLRARGGSVEWRRARIRFLGICWTGMKTLYDAGGKRLSRIPAAVEKSSLLTVPQDRSWRRHYPGATLSIFWQVKGKVGMGNRAVGVTTGRHCDPSRTQTESIGSSRVVCFRCGAPPEADERVRPMSILWGAEDRDEARTFRFKLPPDTLLLATSKPGWGGVTVERRRARRKGGCRLSLSMSSRVAMWGCSIFGLDKSEREVDCRATDRADSGCAEGYVSTQIIEFECPSSKLAGLVIYPRHRARVDWGHMRLPPRPK